MAIIPGAFGKACSINHEHRAASTEVNRNAVQSNDSLKIVSERSNPNAMPLNGIQNSTSDQNRGESSLKRPAKDLQSMKHSEPPTKKITRSIIGDDVKLHFEALSRRIIELEEEKNQLQQELNEQRSAANASKEKYRRKIHELKQERHFTTVCAFCKEPTNSPYFCNQRCEMYYDPAEDEFQHKCNNED